MREWASYVKWKNHCAGQRSRTWIWRADRGCYPARWRFYFRSPIGNLSDAEYLTCYKLSRSDFVESFKRSTELEWIEQESGTDYLQRTCRTVYAYNRSLLARGWAAVELYWTVMENQSIESHCAELMLFNQYLWRKARELEENESVNLRRSGLWDDQGH